VVADVEAFAGCDAAIEPSAVLARIPKQIFGAHAAAQRGLRFLADQSLQQRALFLE